LKCGESNCRLAPDHILALGIGSDMITNIQPYCWSCNSKKHNRKYEDCRDEQTKYSIYKRAFPNLIESMESEQSSDSFLLHGITIHGSTPNF
jgi:hypothetical protein